MALSPPLVSGSKPAKTWLMGSILRRLDARWGALRLPLEEGAVGLWALREGTGLRRLLNSRPSLLHTWPSFGAFFTPLVGLRGHQIFFCG